MAAKHTRRPIGRSVLFDDDPDAYRLGWLVPNGKGPVRDPLHVRAVATPHGWRGYVVDAPVSQGHTEWIGEHWTWEETAPAAAAPPAPVNRANDTAPVNRANDTAPGNLAAAQAAAE